MRIWANSWDRIKEGPYEKAVLQLAANESRKSRESRDIVITHDCVSNILYVVVAQVWRKKLIKQQKAQCNDSQSWKRRSWNEASNKHVYKLDVEYK